MLSNEVLKGDLKQALLEKNQVAVGTLRLLQSEIKNAEINKGVELTSDEILQIIRKEIKKRRDTITLYTERNMPEKTVSEAAEIKILEAYLPAAPSDQQIESFIKEQIAAAPEVTPALKGMIIRATMEHFKGTVDGGTVSRIVNQNIQ